MRILFTILGLVLALGQATAAAPTVSLVTLNCYWLMSGAEGNGQADKPQSRQEYELKAGHLVGLLPAEAPLLVGFQEIGGGEDLTALARAASARLRRRYEALFVPGRDSATGQNVGAILDGSRGWGVDGRAARASDLEKAMSKHLVVRLTNAAAALDVCVVHLRRPIGGDGKAKQLEQNRALLRWAMRPLAKNPKANLAVMGDFNEGHPVGSDDQALAVLFQAKPPMVDALSTLSGKISTHTDGKAYDRILVSEAIAKGLNRLKLERVVIQPHRHGKGEERRFYTDHFPVVATLRMEQ
jgi:hypothetical protein